MCAGPFFMGSRHYPLEFFFFSKKGGKNLNITKDDNKARYFSSYGNLNSSASWKVGARSESQK